MAVTLITDYEDEFDKYMQKTFIEELAGVSGSGWIPYVLDDINVGSFEELKIQYELIQNKKCTHSKRIRDCIEKAYLVITGI